MKNSMSLAVKPIRKRFLIPYIFVLPALLIHLCVVTLPALSSFRMSLYDWNMLGSAVFVGLKNYVEVFTQDSMVFLSVQHNIIWLLIFITVPIILGFTVSILISRMGRSQMFFRTTFFMPYVISAAVAGRIWTALMNPYYGINAIFGSLGLESLSKVKWLGNPDIALFSVAFVDNWHWWGFVMVLFLGALQQVDSTLYEAARVDGANRFQELIHISIPGIRQTIAFVFIMTVMWSFLTFDYVYVMTNGGPANSTEIMATLIYKYAFVKYRAGYASALCVLQCGICVLLYFLNQVVRKHGGLDDD